MPLTQREQTVLKRADPVSLGLEAGQPSQFGKEFNGYEAFLHSKQSFRWFVLRNQIEANVADEKVREEVFENDIGDEVLEYNRLQEKIEREAEQRFLFLKNERIKINKGGFDAYVSDAQLQQDPEYQRLKKSLKKVENNCIRILLKEDGDRDAQWLQSLLKKNELDSKERARLRELFAKRTAIWKRLQQKAKGSLNN